MSDFADVQQKFCTCTKERAMTQESQEPPRKLQIRKYPNRRYYDSTRSRHVTLEEIHALIRSGYDVQVTDSRTGHDITGKVLAQIIIELDPPKLDVFPAPLLHKLLRSSEQLVTDFVQKYFNQALESFLDSQRTMEQAMRSAMGLPTSAPTIADFTKMFWSPLKGTSWSATAATGPGTETPAPPPASPPSPNGEQDLRAVIQDMQKEIERLRRGKKPAGKSRRKPR
jgi:polyhydroxyalkanoate synthesis repressor PhaR